MVYEGKAKEQNKSYPSSRKIRRACNKELYRTLKKLRIWVPPVQMIQAEELYYKKVVSHLLWITENANNRKVLCDWWEEQVCAEIAVLWNLEPAVLAKAFREQFGG